jgi:membrane protein YdbS with pleckstrin-like domain
MPVRRLAATVTVMSTQHLDKPRQVASGLLWIWVESALALTIGMIVVGGFFVLKDPTVVVVLAVMLLGEAIHLTLMHRHRYQMSHDPRLHEHRERRGF